MAQFPVQRLSVQLMAHGIRTVSADSIHPSGCSLSLRPGKGKETERWRWELQAEAQKTFNEGAVEKWHY